jgi:hypothetical protein
MERHDGAAVQRLLEAMHGDCASHRDRGRRRKDDPAAADQEAAQSVEIVALGVFGDGALRRERQAEMDDVADHLQPGPGIDVDAELGAAHPARQQDLRQEYGHRADNADDEGCAGHALGGAVLAGEPGLHARRGAEGECARGAVPSRSGP